MANDIIFKTKAFGGFNKEEVMNYINNLLSEKSETEKRLSESNAKNAKLNAEILEYKKLADESLSVGAQLQETKVLNDELTDKINSLESERNELFDKLNEKDREISQLNESLSNSKLSEDVEQELSSLRGEVARLKADAEKKKDLERQVGAAMLDARIHSEELVEEAKEKANAVTKSVYSAIGETALRIDDLSGGISEIARNFTKAVEEVELRIKALTGDMSKTAQLLISESGVITNISSNTSAEDVKSEYDFSQNTGDATEVTFIPADETEE